MTANTHLLAWCTGLADLPRARAELSEFLGLQRRRADFCSEKLLGLWIDPRWGAQLPCELLCCGQHGKGGVAYIRETIGINGIWMLCWFDIPATTRPLTRSTLLKSLVATIESARTDPPPAFVPVFPDDATAGEVRTELQQLTTEHPDLILAPLYQDASSGRLRTAASHPQIGRTDRRSSRRRSPRRQRLY